MRTIAAHGRTALAVAALQVVLSFALAFNLVVCRGSSGHVAVESALSDCCTGHALPAAEQSLEASSDCDGCTDTPLVQTALQRDRGSKRGPAFLPQVIHLAASSAALRRAPITLGGPPARGALPAPLPDVRRSVVLVV